MSSSAETSPAESAPPPPSPAEAPAAEAQTPHPPLKTQLADLFTSLYRLADLQFSIWLTHLKLTLSRAALFLVFLFVAFILALLALIFLYAGIYHVLTDLFLIPTAWTLLIFAAVHFLLAGIIVLYALRILARKPRPAPDESGDTP